MNPDLEQLQPYPFEKLKELLAQVTPSPALRSISLSIGEPKHPSPQIVLDSLSANMSKLSNYPTTKGLPEFRSAMAKWATKRFSLNSQLCHEDNILPVNGTREAIFSFTQAVIDRTKNALVISPNPFYQIYEGATYLAGANLLLLPANEPNNFTPDYDAVTEAQWKQCQILFLCSPGNPTGSVTSADTLKKLIAFSDKYNFIIASDECYSEIYCNEDKPPVGLLQVCADLGRDQYERCIVFHSLSKRSNLPGLRSGFIAGDASVLKQYFNYRTYHGCAMPIQHQLASIEAWSDESHVVQNRVEYKKKFAAVLNVLQDVMDIKQTDASFYLWPKTHLPDEIFTQKLFEQQHVTVLPGSYVSRTVDGINPGKNHIRMALVASEEDCVEAAKRIKQFILDNK